MTTHTPALLPCPLLALVLACGGGTGKSTGDASASSGDAEGTATTATATTVVTGGSTSTSGATAGATTSTGSSGEASTGAGSSSTGPGTTGASTSTTATSTGEATTGAGTTAGDTGSSSGGEQCQGQGMSCAAVGALCCADLECCAGVPIPEGAEFCSDNCPISDRNLKTEFAAIDPAQVLSRVVDLPISTWRYRKDGAEVRHLGPMAQDFHAAFGLWNTDKMIFPLDASGVSFAAIQALNTRLVAAEAENEALRARLDRLEQALTR